VNLPRFPIPFPGGQVALAVQAGSATDLARALRGMGLTTGVPTIAVVGAGSRPSQVARLGPLLEKVVVRVADAVEATVVDDGARTGVAGLLGQVRHRAGGAFPLVGVASQAGRGAPGGDRDVDHLDGVGDGLDPEHTHFVLVPAHQGAEVAGWLASVADAMAGGNRSVALVTAGGEPAWDAVREHVRSGRLVMAVARTGGAADHLAAAVAGRPADPRATDLARSGQITAVDPARGAAHVADVLRSALSRPDALGPGRPAD
jgi:hypothetical protein